MRKIENILVTGHLGYLGTIITQELRNNDYNVIGIDTNYYKDGLLTEHKINSEVKNIHKDIRDLNLRFHGLII